MAKLFLVLILGGLLAEGIAPEREPPLLIDSSPASSATLDVPNR